MIIKNIERDKYTSVSHEELNKRGVEFSRYKERWDKLAKSIQTVNKDVESVYKYQEGLNNFFRKNNVEGYIFQPDCASTVLRLLHMIFGDKDKNEWIEHFCFELNFGKKWEPGIIRDDNGLDITLQTPEDLYDLLQQSK